MLLDLQNKQGAHYHPVAVTDWGGFALAPFAVATLPDNSNRWIVDPIGFMTKALHPRSAARSGCHHGKRPANPDFTYRRRRICQPGGKARLSALRRSHAERDISKISEHTCHGFHHRREIGSQGLYREKAARHESIAREIFALPHVEIANHSFSHPFKWSKVTTGETGGDYHLDIPGYTFDLKEKSAQRPAISITIFT